ncbi:MAG: hypothetical protein LBM39_00670 [Candidatus Methanoplasma sp.]|nr:hypothetical protein [Candidatus Methanoplasma sp.]
MKSKIIRIMPVITAVLVLSILFVSVVGDDDSVNAEDGIPYIDENGDLKYNDDAVEITNGMTELNDSGPNNGWYYLDSDVSTTNLKIIGNVKIILVDGYKLTATSSNSAAAIGVSAGNTLTIFGQSGGTGEIVAINTGDPYGGPGIGSSIVGDDCGTVIINGGKVTATGGNNGAGIGGGNGRNGGDITINGGTVIAKGGNYAAGIGGGRSGSSGGGNSGKIVINGGNVTATCGASNNGGAAGIGGGDGFDAYLGVGGYGAGGNADEIIINGGTVKATASGYGAGIGGGAGGNGKITIGGNANVEAISASAGAAIGGGFGGYGNVTIDDGTVKATGGSYAAGIGSGYDAPGGNVTINGGNVTATGGYYGAGIGGGSSHASNLTGGNNSNITINGGNVTATGGYYGAAIGGGYFGDNSNITINGGNVTATGGSSGAGIGGGYKGNNSKITITGGFVTATGVYRGAGIGSGSNGDDMVAIISGGTVIAIGSEYAAGIGAVMSYGTHGTITITGGSIYANNTDNPPYEGGMPRPTNGTDPIYMNTFTIGDGAGQKNNYPITAKNIASAPYYGLNDTFTNGNGIVYFWLPESASKELVTLTADGLEHMNLFVRPSDDGNAQTLYLYNISITSDDHTETDYGVAKDFRVTTVCSISAFDITYSLVGAPAGVTIDSNTGLITIQGTVPAGVYQFVVRATTIVDDTDQNFTLTVIPSEYTITANADSNSNITPSGSLTVARHGNKAFTFSANVGYRISDVIVDGVSNANAIAAGTFTFSNVISDHTIDIVSVPEYTITASADGNSVITPSGSQIVVEHGNMTFTFSANAGYRISDVIVDGVSNAAAIAAETFTFSDITSDHTIEVVSEAVVPSTPTPGVPPEYTITAVADDNSKITPSGSQIVKEHGNKTFTFSANAGYRISDVIVDGVSNANAIAAGTFTFTNVTSNHTIYIYTEKAAGPAPEPGPNDGSAGGSEEGTVNGPASTGRGNGGWAVANLILAILTIVAGIVALYSGKNRSVEGDGEKRSKRAFTFRAISAVVGVVSVIVFFLTEDLTRHVVPTDEWTLLMIVLFVIGAAVFIISFGFDRKDEDDADDSMSY